MEDGSGNGAPWSAGLAAPLCVEPTPTGAAFLEQVLAAMRPLLPLPDWIAEHPMSANSPTAREALWARGRRLTGDEDLGFSLAEGIRLEAIAPVWRLFMTAPSLQAMNDSYAVWRTLLFDFMEPFSSEQGDCVRLGLRAPPGVVVDRADQDCRAATIMRVWRNMLGGAELSPLAWRFAYARPSSVRRHVAVLGTQELGFSHPHFEITLSRRQYTATLPGADAKEFATLHAALCRAARVQQEALSMAGRADALATWLLAGPGASAQAVARKLGLSVRTMHRRLAEEGLSFRALVDRVRERETGVFLETGLYTMKQLAREVGFANDRALRHALRRWRART